MKKKFLCSTLAMAMAASMLFGCASESKTETTAAAGETTAAAAETTAEAAKAETNGEKLKVTLLVTGSFGDKAFNDSAQAGMEKLAASIVDTLQGEHYIKAVVGIGTPISSIKDLASSFKEAQIAMEVGKVFDTEKQVISYDHLGIARLIYQLPTTLCEAFLREVFKQDSIDSLDSETLFTIQRFFENNLNVSETSRGLFVHRNTLVYRLEKIKKLTGLDLRKFDDAIVFKVALMVKKYLSSDPARY